jgi:hypothetical protein
MPLRKKDAELIPQTHKVTTFSDARGKYATWREWLGREIGKYMYGEHDLKHHGEVGLNCHKIRHSTLNKHNTANNTYVAQITQKNNHQVNRNYIKPVSIS